MPAHSSLSTRSVLRLMLLALLWGTAFMWMKLAMAGFSAPMVTALRSALGAALLVGVMLATRSAWPGRRVWLHLAVLAIIGIALPYTLFAYAAHLIPTSLAGSINSATPLFTLAIGLLLGRLPRPTRRQLTGLVLGFAGTVVMMRPWDAAGSLLGTVLAVTASACYGLTYNYQAQHASGRAKPVALATGQLLLAGPAAALAIPFFGPPVGHVGPGTAGAMLILGTLSTGVAYLVNYRMIADDGPLLASTVTYLIPVVSIVAGMAVLHEPLHAATLAGIAVTLTGVALTRR